MSNVQPSQGMLTYTYAGSKVFATCQGATYRWICLGCSTTSPKEQPLTEDQARKEIHKHADACVR